MNDGVSDATDKKDGLQFLIHILGDITLHLHTEALEVGGNDIDVLRDGISPNLNHIRDTEIAEKAGGGNNASYSQTWARLLTSKIENSRYANMRESWPNCATIGTASRCALQWATDTNALNCQYVLKINETGQELSGAYYTNAIAIELQIAKGCCRLARGSTP